MTPAGANDAVYSVVPTPSAREARPQRDDADPPPPATVNQLHGNFVEPKKFRMNQPRHGPFVTVLVLRTLEKILRSTGKRGVKKQLKQELECYVTGPHVGKPDAAERALGEQLVA